MIDGIVKLAVAAMSSGEVVLCMLVLNFVAICILIYWVSRYLPKHTSAMYAMLTKMTETQEKGQAAVAEGLKAQAEAIHGFTGVIKGMVDLLNTNATDRKGQPILLSLDGVADRVEDLVRGQQTINEYLESILEKVERIDRDLEVQRRSRSNA